MRTRKDGGETCLGKEKDVKLKCQGIQEHKLTQGDPASQKTTPSTIVHPACNWVDLCPTNNAHDLSIPWKPLQSLWHLQDPQSRGWRPGESHGMIYNLKEKSQPLTKEGPEESTWNCLISVSGEGVSEMKAVEMWVQDGTCTESSVTKENEANSTSRDNGLKLGKLLRPFSLVLIPLNMSWSREERSWSPAVARLKGLGKQEAKRWKHYLV